MSRLKSETATAPRILAVNMECCILCGVCTDLAPHAFELNDAGYIDVLDLDDYEDKDIREAVNNCPRHCIVLE